MSEKFGDSEFKDFMSREYSKEDPLIIIIEAIRSKMLAVSDIYATSLKTYEKLVEGDPLKDSLKKHIEAMMEHTLQTMDQFNYALINGEEDDLDEEGDDSVE